MIELTDVVKDYGKYRALKGISFKVEKGEVVGFLGPNGAGKTTTMKIITGYINATSGMVVIDGEKVSPDKKSIKRKIGYLPENNPIYNDLTVFDYLKFFADLKSLKNYKEEISKVVKMVGISDVIDRKIDTLSKGYKQRVGLAQAILGDPEILILDEPTSGLDPNQIVEIRELIKELGMEKTVILSTHIMQEVETTCERVIIINEGEIVADDKLENLQGRNRRVILEVDKPLNIEDFKQFGEVKRIEENRIEILVEEDLKKEIGKYCFEQGLIVFELSEVEDDLETLFRKLTSKGGKDEA